MSHHRQVAYWNPGFCQNILLRGEMKKARSSALALNLLNAFVMLTERNKHRSHEIHNFIVHTDFLRSSFCVCSTLICEFVDSCALFKCCCILESRRLFQIAGINGGKKTTEKHVLLSGGKYCIIY